MRESERDNKKRTFLSATFISDMHYNCNNSVKNPTSFRDKYISALLIIDSNIKFLL